MQQPSFQHCYWRDVRDEVSNVNPDFAKIIDTLDPDSEHGFIRARYPFGYKIVDQGNLTPIAPFVDSPATETVSSLLNYSCIPLGLILNKSCETFMENERRVIPLNLTRQGLFIGLFENLKPFSHLARNPIWTVTAGARSIFLLPSIHDMRNYKTLRRKYRLTGPMPSQPYEQWELFKTLFHQEITKEPWDTEVLFFTEAWLQHRNDPAWYEFDRYLFETGWASTAYLRDDISLNFLWEALEYTLQTHHFKSSVYQLNTVKHLVSLQLGTFPGFIPSDGGEDIAPTKLLQTIFIEDYGLKDYQPILMHPYSLNSEVDATKVYYSLAMPTLLEGSTNPYPRGILKATKEIQTIMAILRELVHTTSIPLPIRLKAMNYEFFHTTPNHEVQAFAELPKRDRTLTKISSYFPDRSFPEYSLFGRGCIQLGRQETV